jgi:hypothetical protein
VCGRPSIRRQRRLHCCQLTDLRNCSIERHADRLAWEQEVDIPCYCPAAAEPIRLTVRLVDQSGGIVGK